jgi:hypothetical protein
VWGHGHQGDVPGHPSVVPGHSPVAPGIRPWSMDKWLMSMDKWLMSTDRSLELVAASPLSADQGAGFTGSPSPGALPGIAAVTAGGRLKA